MTKEIAAKIVETAEKTTELAKIYTELAEAMEEQTDVLTCETVAINSAANRFHLVFTKDVKSLAEIYGTPVENNGRETYTRINGIKFFSLKNKNDLDD